MIKQKIEKAISIKTTIEDMKKIEKFSMEKRIPIAIMVRKIVLDKIDEDKKNER